MLQIESAEEAKNYGNNAFKNGDWPTAIALYSRAMELANGDPDIAHILHSNRSAAYIHVDDYQAALNDADSAIKLKPDWARGYQRRGTALCKLKRLHAAVEAYSRAVELKAQDKETLNGLENARTALAEAQKCLGGLYDILSQGKDRIVQSLSGDERTKSLAEDESFVKRLMFIAEEPALFGTIDLLDARVVTALEVLGGPIDDFKHNPEDESNKDDGVDGHKEEEREEEDVVNVESLMKLAMINIDRGTLWEAAELLERAAKISPRNVNVYLKLADVYERIGDWKLMDRWCRRGLVCCYGSEACHELDDGVARASSHLKRDNVGSVNDAALMYAVQLHMGGIGSPNLAERFAELGTRLFAAGHFEEAAECFGASAEESPDEKVKAVQHGHRAVSLMKLGRYFDALGDCSKCCSGLSDDIHAKIRLIWCLTQCGGEDHINEARQIIQQILTIDPDNKDCITSLRLLDECMR